MTGQATERLHVLFVLHHPGFLRHYETTLAALSEKGHRITLGFNVARNKTGEQVQMRRLLERCPSIRVVPMPAPTVNRWYYLARAVRLLQDYGRYFDPRYEAATALRSRAADELPPVLEWIGRAWNRFEHGRTLFGSCLRAAERAIPLNPAIHTFLSGLAPDVLLLTPLVDWGSDQVHCLKSAAALGIPSALCVASWDNLTNKGAIRYTPTRVIVWNEAQQREAVEFHGIPPSRVVVTGAQTFDHWFGRQPSRSREAFCAQLGLDPEKPILLYLGSSFFIAPDEAQFFDRFLRAMRQSSDPRLREAGVIVRPHPLNIQQWLAFDFTGLGHVTVFPNRAGVDAFTEAFRDDFYDSLHHAAATVGVNTSAMLEAGIVGRPVFTVLAPEFRHSQEGTIHFRHLTGEGGGVVVVNNGIEEALEAIGHALSNPAEYETRARRYIERFVRPNGWDTPASEHLQSAIEAMGAHEAPVPEARWAHPWVRLILTLPSLWATLLLRPEAKYRWKGPLGPIDGTIVKAIFLTCVYLAAALFWAKDRIVGLGDLCVSAYFTSRKAVREVWKAARWKWRDATVAMAPLWRMVSDLESLSWRVRRNVRKRLLRSLRAVEDVAKAGRRLTHQQKNRARRGGQRLRRRLGEIRLRLTRSLGGASRQ